MPGQAEPEHQKIRLKPYIGNLYRILPYLSAWFEDCSAYQTQLELNLYAMTKAIKQAMAAKNS